VVTSGGPPGAPDTLDPGFWGDLDAMHETFRTLRTQGPLARDEANNLWIAVSHSAVLEIERRADTFLNSEGYRSFALPDEDNMIALDDPRHAEQRRVVSRQFTPRAVRGNESYLTALIGELVDAFLADDSFEVVSQLAAPLPARLTAHLLGFDERRWRDLQSWSERLMRYDAALTDVEARTGIAAAIAEFGPRLLDLSEGRRTDPADDLISVWANALLDGCPLAR